MYTIKARQKRAAKRIGYANKRKSAYLARHEKTRKVVGSKSYYAAKILWS